MEERTSLSSRRNTSTTKARDIHRDKRRQDIDKRLDRQPLQLSMYRLNRLSTVQHPCVQVVRCGLGLPVVGNQYQPRTRMDELTTARVGVEKVRLDLPDFKSQIRCHTRPPELVDT